MRAKPFVVILNKQLLQKTQSKTATTPLQSLGNLSKKEKQRKSSNKSLLFRITRLNKRGIN